MHDEPCLDFRGVSCEHYIPDWSSWFHSWFAASASHKTRSLLTAKTGFGSTFRSKNWLDLLKLCERHFQENSFFMCSLLNLKDNIEH